MADVDPPLGLLDRGELPFKIESRLIRELGERLVRQPEVALLELVKNAYDADARRCEIRMPGNDVLEVADDGVGMTLAQFQDGWMRIGTSSKADDAVSHRFKRPITGEKGIGRFAVRYLGQSLKLVSVAYDEERAAKTRLEAHFDWDEFDRRQELEDVKIPYELAAEDDSTETGTILSIGELKPTVGKLDWKALRTGSMGVVSPIRSLLRKADGTGALAVRGADPGFELASFAGEEETSLGEQVLSRYALRSTIDLRDGKLDLQVFAAGREEPYLRIRDKYGGDLGHVRAEIRFFPRREGLFTGVGFDGRTAYKWIRDNSGVKVFDRAFQIRPYGTEGDDWLDLLTDAVRSLREPVSPIMQKHYPMDPAVKSDTALNWMLRLPENKQVVGVVQVDSRRESEGLDVGLVPAADREGFLANDSYERLRLLVRGALEAMAYADREITLEEARRQAELELEQARDATKRAIAEVERDTAIPATSRARLIQVLEESQDRAERQRAGSREREQQLEIMSLLGVVAGFMTHEFGVALSELKTVRAELAELAKEMPAYADKVQAFDSHIETLRSFVRYSRAYVEGAKATIVKPYKAKPRFDHVVAAFGRYAEKRRIEVQVDVEPDVIAPAVPPALYDGIAQNLFTNSLKALTASTRESDRRIVFRAWNDARMHHVQVSDTGIGVPDTIRGLVFDPLFTTTDRNSSDPLGTGMGLGLALVRRGAAAFGGKADLVAPPPGFTTCVEVVFPRERTE